MGLPSRDTSPRRLSPRPDRLGPATFLRGSCNCKHPLDAGSSSQAETHTLPGPGPGPGRKRQGPAWGGVPSWRPPPDLNKVWALPLHPAPQPTTAQGRVEQLRQDFEADPQGLPHPRTPAASHLPRGLLIG